jgi:hypothetical protein
MLQLGIRGLGIARFKFNPLSWFLKGEQGAWYDPSDLTSLYQESTGVTPMAAVGTVTDQPVGLMLDKSKGLALGAELSAYSSGFSSLTGINGVNSTNSISSNELINTATNTTGVARVEIPISGLVIGAIYNIEIVARASNLASSPDIRASTALNIPQTSLSTVSTKYTFRVSASAVSGVIRIYSQDSSGLIGDTATVTNISVRQIAGNHAFQATPANRPLLSARVNLLTKTEDFSDAVWGGPGVTITVGEISPNGTMTANTIVSNGTVLAHGFGTSTQLLGANYIVSIYAKAGTNNFVQIYCDNTNTDYANFDIRNGLPGDKGSSTQLPTITNIGNGWYRCSLVTGAAASKNINVRIISGLTSARNEINTLTTSIHAWGADIRPTNAGALLPPYQRVNTASDYDAVGFPLYLACKGLQSAMSTNSIDFTSTDKMTVVTGVRWIDNNSILFELSGNTDTTNGAFYKYFDPLNGTPRVSIRGTVASCNFDYNPKVLKLTTNVFSENINLNSSSVIGRLNGATNTMIQTGTTTAGNFSNNILFLFSRGGTQLWFNGQFYGAIIRGAQSDTASVTQTENYMATKTGITF